MQAILAQGHRTPTHLELAETAGVDRRTIANVLKEGRAERLLVGGRPARLGPGLGLVLGISLGAESLRGGLVDANGAVHCTFADDRAPGQHEASPEALLARVRAMGVRVLSAALKSPELSGPDAGVLRLLGIAVAWPVPIDRSKRVTGNVLPDGGWRRRDPDTGRVPSLPELIAAAFRGPFDVNRCHALNDSSAAALAVAFDESRARAEEPDDDRWRVALVVRVGGALGVGTILLAPHNRRRLSFIDSLLVEGTNGLAGELGHLAIGRRLIKDINAASHDDLAPMSYDEWTCLCGAHHHLHAFASGAAVVKRLQASGYTIPRDDRGPASVLREFLEGNPDDLQIHAVRDAGRILGRALAGPILMLDPYSITVTGSLASEHLVDGIRRERDMWAHAIKDAVQVSHREGPLSEFIGVRGAALAVIRREIYRAFLDGRSALPRTFPFGASDLRELASNRAR